MVLLIVGDGLLVAHLWQSAPSTRWISLILHLLCFFLLVPWVLLRYLRSHQKNWRLNEERFRASFEQVAVGMCYTDLNGAFLHVNRRFCSIIGYTADELLTSSFHALTHPDDVAADTVRGRQLLAGELATYTLEKRLLPKDGIVTWVSITVTPMYGPTGAVEQLLSVVEDITDRKLAEWALRQLNATLEERVAERTATLTLVNEQLYAEIAVRERAEQAQRESEQQYRKLLENLRQGVVVLQVEPVVFCNQALAAIFGYTSEEIMTSSLDQLQAILPSDDQGQILAEVQNALVNGLAISEASIRIKRGYDGTNRWLHTSSSIIIYNGQPAMLTVLSDITELKAAEDRLRQSDARLYMLLAKTPAVIFTTKTDDDFGTTFVSDSIQNVLGYEPTLFIADARFWFNRIHPDDRPQILAEGRLTLERGWHQYAYRIRHADGSYRWVENGMSLLLGTDGRPTELIGYLIDITERKAAEEALRQSRDELRTANVELARAARLKDEFLSNMSHELRTPLNAVLGRAELLREAAHGPLTERQLRSVISIEESGRHLLELINDILDLSKIEANKLDMHIQPISVGDLCYAILRLMGEMAQKKRIMLSADIDPHVSIIEGDPRRLKQILFNLLSNAVKFTPADGKIGLEVRGDSKAGRLTFTVWDTGIGIAVTDLPRLFRPFEQIDSKLNRHYEGTGLGLSLVARLTKLHGGSVHVESELGQGSRFTVTLPWSPRERLINSEADR